jgi:hypothetical protein
MTFSNGYLYRRRITFPFVTGSHNNGILLISGTFDYLKSTANGGKSETLYDIRFEQGGALIPFELKKWDRTTGQLIAFVKVPAYSASDNIEIYYGNASQSVTEQDLANTWSNYWAVWHLGATTDSTGNGYTLTLKGVGEPLAVTGKIDQGYQFDGVNDYTSFPAIPTLTGVTTLQMFVNLTSKASRMRIFNSNFWNSMYIDTASTNLVAFLGNGTAYGNSNTLSTMVDYGAWNLYHFVNSASGAGGGKAYKNGSLKASLHSGGLGSMSQNPSYLGAQSAGGDSTKGSLEEVRIAKSELSAELIATEYANMNDPATFVSISHEIASIPNVTGAITGTLLKNKTFTVKIYDKTGTTLLGTWSPLTGYPFTKVINGGCGEMSIDLPRTFDRYNTDGTVAFLNKVEVWVQDIDTRATSGILVYSGFIADIEIGIQDGQESVKIKTLGHYVRLGFVLHWDGTNVRMTYNSTDPADIVKDIVDKFRANETDPFINYSATSIPALGFTVSYSSDSKFGLELLDKIKEMTGVDYYYFFDASNILTFKQKPATATHTFTMGANVQNLRILKSWTDIANVLVAWNGLQEDDTNFLSKMYYNSASIASYWSKMERMTDGRITDPAYMLKLGTAFVNANKDPNVSIQLRVTDNNFDTERGYDIESINPGDTCKILNLSDPDIYSSNLLITKVTVDGEGRFADIVVEDKRALTGKELNDVRRGLSDAVYSDGISNITKVSV